MKVNHYKANPEFNEPEKVVFFPEDSYEEVALVHLHKCRGEMVISKQGRQVLSLTIDLPEAEQ